MIEAITEQKENASVGRLTELASLEDLFRKGLVVLSEVDLRFIIFVAAPQSQNISDLCGVAWSESELIYHLCLLGRTLGTKNVVERLELGLLHEEGFFFLRDGGPEDLGVEQTSRKDVRDGHTIDEHWSGTVCRSNTSWMRSGSSGTYWRSAHALALDSAALCFCFRFLCSLNQELLLYDCELLISRRQLAREAAFVFVLLLQELGILLLKGCAIGVAVRVVGSSQSIGVGEVEWRKLALINNFDSRLPTSARLDDCPSKGSAGKDNC